MSSNLMRLTLGVFVAAALFMAAAAVKALNVQPVVVDLLSSGRQSSAVITLENTFSTTVPVELSARRVEIVDGELRETAEEADDLLIFPMQAAVPSGASQAFRIQWIGDPAPDASRHYFVTVAQLPVDLPENQNAIQVLYNFKILVNVGAPGAAPKLEVRSAAISVDEEGVARPVITVANSGGSYGYVGHARMTVVQRTPAGEEVFRKTFEPQEIQSLMGLGLVPSGSERRLPVNLPLPRADGSVTIELASVSGR
mgnify:FL=1